MLIAGAVLVNRQKKNNVSDSVSPKQRIESAGTIEALSIRPEIRNTIPATESQEDHELEHKRLDDDDDEDEDEDDEDEDDHTLENLEEQDASNILSPTISRKCTASTADYAARTRPTRPATLNRRPSPPKKGFFSSSNRNALSSLGHNFFTKPRSSSVGAKTNDAERSPLFPSFNLPNFDFPRIPTLSSITDSAKSSYSNQIQGMTRHLRTNSLFDSTKAIQNSSSQSPSPTPTPNRSESDDSTMTNRLASQSPIQVRDFSSTMDQPRFVSTQTVTSPLNPVHGLHTIHRSNSDSSLHRTLSLNSSIGDDSRFLDVQKQVNSRFKAVKDSILPDLMESFSFNNATLPKRLSLATATPAPEHPLDTLRRVDIVILGGYRGSILHKVKPIFEGSTDLRRGRRVWVPIKVGLKLRKVDLEVPLDPQAELDMEKHIIPTGMLTNIGPVDISRRLLKRLRANPNIRVHEFSYDWRLSPKINSDKLLSFMEQLPSNQHLMRYMKPHETDGYEPMVIAHSLGGLITRHAINRRPDLFRGGVCYAGVPQRCINILGPLKHGDAVLLNHNVLTAQVNFTFRSSFVFLPEDGKCFVDRRTGEDIAIDMYDAKVWQELNLSPCVSTSGVMGSGGLLNSASSAMAAVLRETKEIKDKLQHLTPPASPGHPGFQQPRPITPPSEWGDSRSISISESGLYQPNVGALKSASESTESRQFSEAPDKWEQTLNDAKDFEASGGGTMGPNMHNDPSHLDGAYNTQTSTLSLSDSMPYLTATLESTRKFRAETRYRQELAQEYPPFVVLYAKTTPTVKGARVDGRDAIKRSDCYDDLLFGAGDGVCLARNAMLPEGYRCEKRVAVDRGHVALLGDLDGVGTCIQTLVEARESIKRRKQPEA